MFGGRSNSLLPHGLMKRRAARDSSKRNSVACLLVVILCSTLLSPCLGSGLDYPASQHLLSQEPSLKWDVCGELNNHTVECSRIEVPMDHLNKSSEKTFSIPVIRMLATNTSATGGKTIFLNPGGPGGSGFSFLWRAGEMLNRIIGEGFHLLSFDPRGVNGSIPQASCYVSAAQRAEQIEHVPWDVEFEAGRMFTTAENQAKACTETMGEHGAYVNTPQTAADMNSILDAIGQEKMYYWGFSYGTTLGQTYAQMFPERVSRLIIDGVSNLDDWYNAFYDSEDLIDTDKIYAGFVEQCFKAKENCPLYASTKFATASELKRHIDEFLQQLEEEPIAVYVNNSNYGSVTRRAIATNGIFPALYRPISWPVLARNLAELISGNATPAYDAYSDSWVTSIIGDETNTFVVLNDNLKSGPAAPVHGIKAIQNFTLTVPEPSQLISKYMGSDLYGKASWSIPTTHKFRPRYHPEFPRVKTAEPILVLSTTFDPVCPLISATKAHDSFEGAGFVEQLSYGHCTISMASLCMAKHVRSYFYDGVIPDEGATCEIDIEYFPAPGKSSLASSLEGIAQEDAELLSALHELAEADVVNHVPFRRGRGF